LKKRLIIIIAIAMCITLASIVIINIRNEAQRPMVNLNMYFYAISLGFEFRIVINNNEFNASTLVFERIMPDSSRFDPFFTEIIFLNNASESINIPDHIIAAWPRESTVDHLIDGFHVFINRTEEELTSLRLNRPVINLKDFNLSYPLTNIDLINNWEQVYAMFLTLSPIEQERFAMVTRIAN